MVEIVTQRLAIAGKIQQDVHTTLQEESFSTSATYGGPTLNPKPKTQKEYCSALFQSKSKAMGLVWTGLTHHPPPPPHKLFYNFHNTLEVQGLYIILI
jgi:hypothetical protein